MYLQSLIEVCTESPEHAKKSFRITTLEQKALRARFKGFIGALAPHLPDLCE